MFRRQFLLAVAILMLGGSFCLAGIRSEGKYCGTVIYDRWGACTLYSGTYVMYVSEAIKQQLLGEAGKSIQVDATQVYQPQNPGDGLIKQLKVLGPARLEQSTEGIKLTATPAFKDGQPPTVAIRVENVREQSILLRMNWLAPTLLAKRGQSGPSDGPSVAVVTRQSFWSSDGARMKGADPVWSWKVVEPATLQQQLTVMPHESFEIRLAFALPAGEYDFLAGYGGGVHESRCLASNLLAFDVEPDGTAHLAKVSGR